MAFFLVFFPGRLCRESKIRDDPRNSGRLIILVQDHKRNAKPYKLINCVGANLARAMHPCRSTKHNAVVDVVRYGLPGVDTAVVNKRRSPLELSDKHLECDRK